MAEELNMHFSSVFTREDTSSLPVPETKFNGTRGGSRAGSLGGAQQLTGGGVVAELSVISRSRADSAGRGVAAIFRGLRNPARFSGG